MNTYSPKWLRLWDGWYGEGCVWFEGKDSLWSLWAGIRKFVVDSVDWSSLLLDTACSHFVFHLIYLNIIHLYIHLLNCPTYPSYSFYIDHIDWLCQWTHSTTPVTHRYYRQGYLHWYLSLRRRRHSVCHNQEWSRTRFRSCVQGCHEIG